MKTNALSIAAKSSSKLTSGLMMTLIILGLLILPCVVDPGPVHSNGSFSYAAQGGNGNGGGDNDNGGGKGGPDKGDLYGDAIYVKRDAWGVPVLDSENCQQPLAWDTESESMVSLPLVWDIGEEPQLEDVPDLCIEDSNELFRAQTQLATVMMASHTVVDITLDSDELDACDITPLCADDTIEVELGRLSSLRAPIDVLERQRDEAIHNIQNASHLALDHGGRIMINGSAMDSPLINLALWYEFHLWWKLQTTGDTPETVFDPSNEFGEHYTPVLAAAFGLGAGDDKLGAGIDKDVVIHSNRSAGLPGNEYEGFPETINFHDELFINYEDFVYDRSLVFPGCITWDYYDEKLQPPGWVLDHSATIIDAVFGNDETPYPGALTNIAGFALAANDARRVLAFVHDIGDDQLRGRVDVVFENSGLHCP